MASVSRGSVEDGGTLQKKRDQFPRFRVYQTMCIGAVFNGQHFPHSGKTSQDLGFQLLLSRKWCGLIGVLGVAFALWRNLCAWKFGTTIEL